MRSRVAESVARDRQARIDAMTPTERVALLDRLSAEGLRQFMQVHGLDRTTAIARIKATRQSGRRPSASARADSA